MKVPSPGESIKEVEIATWLVKDGDYVEKDQAIAEVDSDKATLELPAEVSGTITLKAEEGDTVAVGAVVCLIDTEGKPSGAAPAAESPKVVEAPKPAAAEVKAAPAAATYASGTPSPAAAPRCRSIPACSNASTPAPPMPRPSRSIPSGSHAG